VNLTLSRNKPQSHDQTKRLKRLLKVLEARSVFLRGTRSLFHSYLICRCKVDVGMHELTECSHTRQLMVDQGDHLSHLKVHKLLNHKRVQLIQYWHDMVRMQLLEVCS